MINDIAGVILAGGKSSRMGTNKAFLPYGQKQQPLISTVIQKLSLVFSRVLLSVTNQELFNTFGLPLVVDRYSAIGPIGGIVSVLEEGEQRIFCVACDMPFLNPEFIRFVCSYNQDAVLPVWRDRWESLHAVYSSKLLPLLHSAIENQKYKLSEALTDCNVGLIFEPEIKRFDAEGRCFANINTPIDYAKLQG